MLSSYYLSIKALHIISMTAWMAGLFYLPRLFVYHAQTESGSEADRMLQTMERRLLYAIMHPAMAATLLTGGLLWWITLAPVLPGWIHIKLTAVVGLVVFQLQLGRWRRAFASGVSPHSSVFFRVVNEWPTVCLIVAVFAVVMQW
jgi:putative membrane protein